MIIKKYLADNMNEALNMIRFEMGSDAIIVSKKNVRQKGFFGMFKPKKLEVTAAVDDVAKEKIRQKSPEPELDSEKVKLEKELIEVKEMLQKLTDDKQVKGGKKTGLKKILIERDVSEEVINSLISDIRKKGQYKDNARIPDMVLREEIANLIKVDNKMESRIHAFVGPTGVGKTTTIAKLAAIQSINHGRKVGLITIDTYRIGAVEQLKIYADILGLPLEVVNSLNDIDGALKKLEGCDLILVDTTGRSTKNVMQLSEMKLYVDKIKPNNVHLVLSMTTKYRDLLQILKGFAGMNYNSIILTKFDETGTYGSIINIAYNAKAPISYITIGQNVPDDIQEAAKQKLLELTIGEGVL